jgi:hypothetical protein
MQTPFELVSAWIGLVGSDLVDRATNSGKYGKTDERNKIAKLY